jgi:hypothetical protein
VSWTGCNQRCESVSHPLKRRDACLDVQELRFGRALDAPDIPLCRQGEQLLDLLQRESEALRATNKA